MLTVPEAEHLVAAYFGKLLGYERRSPLPNESSWSTSFVGRADELAVVNLAINRALDRYAASEFAPDLYKGRTVADVVAALKRRWGISRYPERTVLVDEAGKIGHSTLRNWEQRAYGSETFRSELDRALRAHASRPARNDDDWLTVLPSAFPPESASRTTLLTLARRAGLTGEEREAVQTIRQVVTQRVRTYLAAEPRHLIHHREIVESAWFWDDLRFVEPVRGMLARRGQSTASVEQGVFLRVSKAVVTLQFFLCLADGAHFMKQIEATAQSRLAYKVFLERAAPQPLVIAKVPRLVSIPSIEAVAHIDPASPAGEAIYLAYAVRAATRSERPALVQNYLEVRRSIQPHLTSYSEPHVRTVLQADQSVSHDAMDAMDRVGFEAVDALRSAASPANPLSSYRAMTWRDRGLFASKHGQLARATQITDRGIRELSMLDDEHRGDNRAFLESLHQHLLSNAGTAAKIVENLLVDIPRREAHRRSQRVYKRWATAAVSYASRAYSALIKLDMQAGDGLPEKRHEDGFISSRDWPIQTKIMHLRALLGAHTLLASTVPEEDRDAIADRAMMRLLYSEIASDVRLRRPRTFTFTQLAMWLALVDDMTLPHIPQPSTGLSEVSFLARSGAEVSPGVSTVHIDEERVMRTKFWFGQAKGWDRGPITRVRPGTAVAWSLARRTDNISETWLRDDPA